MTINCHNYQEIIPVKVTKWNHEPNKIPVALLCQHGSRGKVLFDMYDVTKYLHPDDVAFFDEYLDIERDVATFELTLALAYKLAERFSVTTYEVLYHRGIIDPNRTPETAIKNIFDKEAFPFRKQWEILHSYTLQIISKGLEKVKNRGGICLDIHSMGDYNPNGDGVERRGRLEEHIFAWKSSYNVGQDLRGLDIVVSVEGRTEQVGNEKLAVAMENEFRRNKVLHFRDKPYKTEEQIATTYYLEICPGLALDIPKNMLADGNLGERYDISKLTADFSKIDFMANMLNEAVIDFFQFPQAKQ